MKDFQKSKELVNGYRVYRVTDTAKHETAYVVRHRRFTTAKEAMEYAKSIETGKDK